MPLIETKGAASAQGFGEFAKTGVATYIEDVFSTWLYTGNGSTQTITNGIDLSTYGGMIWLKNRTTANSHWLQDTARVSGSNLNFLHSDTTQAENSGGNYGVSGISTTGFTLASGNGTNTNGSSNTYASWTFRKQAKFFDIVTYTGNGSAQTINHNLGSVPGCIIIKTTSTNDNWRVYHRSVGNQYVMTLNSDIAKVGPSAAHWNNTDPTATQFTVGTNGSQASTTYVAYLFAHNAGGFGLTGTDNVVSCGSYVGNGVTAGPTVTLGYEPQFVIIKNATNVNDWHMFDTMRGMAVSDGSDARLFPNLSNAESLDTAISPTATGFVVESSSGRYNASGDTYIYIAIRRGPMKTPTSGTSVYTSSTGTNSATIPTFTANFPVDWIFAKNPAATFSWEVAQRLTGGYGLAFNSTAAESGPLSDYVFDSNIGAWTNYPNTFRSWMFRRAPGFFDEVCYTGTSANRTVNHNLSAVPELMIVKSRSNTFNWCVYASGIGATDFLILNSTGAKLTLSTVWNNTTPTASVFSLGTANAVNNSGDTFVAYLFATVAGVSKVGSYTGTGTTLQVDCGFTGGARFVLIKRTDSTGDWFTYDSARGISSGNDPYLLLNSTAAEVTGTNYVDTDSTGFKVTAAAPAGLNASGGTYIFLAIA